VSGRCYDPAVARRISLPISVDPRMTLARAREKLGGRVSSHGRGGEVVRVGEDVGVVLWSDEVRCDVWIGSDRIKRVATAEASLAPSTVAMGSVAEDARAFAGLEEGADVVFDEKVQGRLLEKCRWGGLVGAEDGRVFAVGFRRFVRRLAN
jgi:hypothetical protein